MPRLNLDKFRFGNVQEHFLALKNLILSWIRRYLGAMLHLSAVPAISSDAELEGSGGRSGDGLDGADCLSECHYLICSILLYFLSLGLEVVYVKKTALKKSSAHWKCKKRVEG